MACPHWIRHRHVQTFVILVAPFSQLFLRQHKFFQSACPLSKGVSLFMSPLKSQVGNCFNNILICSLSLLLNFHSLHNIVLTPSGWAGIDKQEK